MLIYEKYTRYISLAGSTARDWSSSQASWEAINRLFTMSFNKVRALLHVPKYVQAAMIVSLGGILFG